MAELNNKERGLLEKLRSEKELSMHDGYDLAIKILTANVIIEDAIHVCIKGKLRTIVDDYETGTAEETEEPIEVALPAFLLIVYNSVFDTDGAESIVFGDEREPNDKRLYSYEYEVNTLVYKA